MIDEPDSAEARAIPPGSLATPKHMLLAAGIIAGGLVAGGFLLGDGLVRKVCAERLLLRHKPCRTMPRPWQRSSKFT